MELWCSDRWSRLLAWGSEESWHDREGSATSCGGVVDELEDDEDDEDDFWIFDMVSQKSVICVGVCVGGTLRGSDATATSECRARRGLEGLE